MLILGFVNLMFPIFKFQALCGKKRIATRVVVCGLGWQSAFIYAKGWKFLKGADLYVQTQGPPLPRLCPLGPLQPLRFAARLH